MVPNYCSECQGPAIRFQFYVGSEFDKIYGYCIDHANEWYLRDDLPVLDKREIETEVKAYLAIKEIMNS